MFLGFLKEPILDCFGNFGLVDCQYLAVAGEFFFVEGRMFDGVFVYGMLVEGVLAI